MIKKYEYTTFSDELARKLYDAVRGEASMDFDPTAPTHQKYRIMARVALDAIYNRCL